MGRGIRFYSYTGREHNSMTDEETGFRHVSMEAINEVPDLHSISLDVQLMNSLVTREHPARIRITMSNRSRTDRVYVTGYMRVFGEVWSAETAPGLVLLPPELPLEFEDHQFRPTERNIAFDAAEIVNRLPPDESTSIQYDVWDAPQNTGEPLKPGTYRFQSEYIRYSSCGNLEDSFVWGVTLSITRP